MYLGGFSYLGGLVGSHGFYNGCQRIVPRKQGDKNEDCTNGDGSGLVLGLGFVLGRVLGLVLGLVFCHGGSGRAVLVAVAVGGWWAAVAGSVALGWLLPGPAAEGGGCESRGGESGDEDGDLHIDGGLGVETSGPVLLEVGSGD